MTRASRLIVLLAGLAAAGGAFAAEPEALATAPAATSGAPSASGQSVADQIDAYLKTSPAAALPRDAASGVTSGDEPRKAHGFVDVAVGTGGYRSAFVRSDLPIGKTGTLSIAAGETRFGDRLVRGYAGPYGAGTRQSVGLGLFLGGAEADPRGPRCRSPDDAGYDRSDAALDVGRARGCRAAEPVPPAGR